MLISSYFHQLSQDSKIRTLEKQMFLHHIRLTQLSEQDLKKNTIDVHQLRLALLVLIFVEAWVYYHYNHITTPPTIVNLRANL